MGLFLTSETACSQKLHRFQSRTRTFKFPALPGLNQVFLFFFTFLKTIRSAARRSFVPEWLLPSPIVLTLSCYYISTSMPTAAHLLSERTAPWALHSSSTGTPASLRDFRPVVTHMSHTLKLKGRRQAALGSQQRSKVESCALSDRPPSLRRPHNMKHKDSPLEWSSGDVEMTKKVVRATPVQ